MKILVINGPNMNMLGKREVDVYGKKTYADLVSEVEKYAKTVNVAVSFVQTSYEGRIVDEILNFEGDGIVLNAAAYSHYSYAIFDAIKSVSTPVVEVHMSDVFKREEFRKNLVLSAACVDTISGKGIEGYKEGIDRIVKIKNG